MDYLQYMQVGSTLKKANTYSFKPYYKWITFNTKGGKS